MRIILLSFIILFISCENPNRKTGYEHILGRENIETLDLIVIDFEKNILKSKYPDLNLSDSYYRFIQEYCDRESNNWLKIPNSIKRRFNKSQLKSEMYYHPDSVWIMENSTFDKVESDSLIFLNHESPYVKARVLDQIFSYEDSLVYKYERYYPLINSTTNRDSILSIISNIKYYNRNGKWDYAIRSMHNSEGFYQEYAAYKMSRDKQRFCEIIVEQNELNASIKRLIVLECIL